jgi:hypothetical protein
MFSYNWSKYKLSKNINLYDIHRHPFKVTESEYKASSTFSISNPIHGFAPLKWEIFHLLVPLLYAHTNITIKSSSKTTYSMKPTMQSLVKSGH